MSSSWPFAVSTAGQSLMNAPARCVCVWSVHVLTDAELSYQYVGLHATCLATHQSVADWEWMNELADSPDRSTR